MPETIAKTLTPAEVLKGESPLVLTALLRPVGGLDRFQPAGFPEIGHVIYQAPRTNGDFEFICIVDSPASMANHLESICLRGPHDLELCEDLEGMPYLRCVTGELDDKKLRDQQTVVTSLTEGHRVASTYFLGEKTSEKKKKNGKSTGGKKNGQRVNADSTLRGTIFSDELAEEMGIELKDSSKAHPPPEKWWNVFRTIFKYDPNALVHGVLFPQWQVKIPRVLTAHLEALGADRVERSGVKFDRLGKTTSGQPIFAIDDETAREIKATFIIDVALVRSFGRGERGLTEKQKEFLVAFALWKIRKLVATPFRFRSGCHLELESLILGVPGTQSDSMRAEISVDIKTAIKDAFEGQGAVTEIYWPKEELYREPEPASAGTAPEDPESEDEDGESEET